MKMCISSKLSFPVEKELVLPPLPSSFIKCSLVTPNDDARKTCILTNANLPFSASQLRNANVTSARQLSNGDNVKKTIEVTFNVQDFGFNYLPGDSIGVLPKNPESEVDMILKRLNLTESCLDLYRIEIDESSKKKKSSLPPHIPSISSIRYLFEYCLDLRAVLRKGFIRGLAEHTEDVQERRRLGELCSREGSTEYNKYIVQNSSSLMDILMSFPSCQPPLSLILEHLPRLQPRAYSIASSPLEDPNNIRIVFSVVEDSRGRRGICSGWLFDITRPFHDVHIQMEHLNLKGSVSVCQVPLYLRKRTSFCIPEDPAVPLIMIGPGTGIAPFIGFLEHRRKQWQGNGIKKPENWLFFGCRHKNRDELYRKEVTSFESENLCRYYVCYSRDESLQYSKYVQELIYLKKEEFVKFMLNERTCTFICGDGLYMEKNVINTITDCIKIGEGVEDDVAKEILHSLEKDGRLLRDVWR